MTSEGPTRVIGPTGHAIGGTAQLELLSSSTPAIIACPRHYPGWFYVSVDAACAGYLL